MMRFSPNYCCFTRMPNGATLIKTADVRRGTWFATCNRIVPDSLSD